MWFAVADGKLYLSHEGEYTDWIKNLVKNSRVSVKIGLLEFEATTKILRAGRLRDLGSKALYEKYYHSAKKEVIDNWFSLSTVVQLTPIGTL